MLKVRSGREFTQIGTYGPFHQTCPIRNASFLKARAKNLFLRVFADYGRGQELTTEVLRAKLSWSIGSQTAFHWRGMALVFNFDGGVGAVGLFSWRSSCIFACVFIQLENRWNGIVVWWFGRVCLCLYHSLLSCSSNLAMILFWVAFSFSVFRDVGLRCWRFVRLSHFWANEYRPLTSVFEMTGPCCTSLRSCSEGLSSV